MINEQTKIKKELEKYKSIVEKFTFSSERLNMLLKDQRTVFNHSDLRYKPFNKQRTVENLFIKFILEKQKATICHYYGKNGHKSYVCNDRLRTHLDKVEIRVKSCRPLATKKVTQIWLPKRTNPRNLVVSKKSWIPKLT